MVDANKGGVLVVVEGLKGFVPFSEILMVFSIGSLKTFILINAKYTLLSFLFVFLSILVSRNTDVNIFESLVFL